MAGIGHLLVGAMLGRAYPARSRAERVKAYVAFAALGLLPDFDVLFVALGSPDRGLWGHRGITHAWLFAFLVAVGSYFWARWRKLPALVTAALTFCAVASHGVLDALTADSRGIMFLWPFMGERLEFPFRPIPNPPTGLDFVSVVGFTRAAVELCCFAPMLVALWAWPAMSEKLAHARYAALVIVATSGFVSLSTAFALFIVRPLLG